MSDNRNPGFDTLAIHAGAQPDPATGARQTPVYQTTSYVFDDVDHAASLFNLQKLGFIYSRLTNPTVAVLEERVASLEGGIGRHRHLLRPCRAAAGPVPVHGAGGGDRRGAQALWRLHQPARQQLQARLRLEKTTFVDSDDPENFRAAITENHQGALHRKPGQSRRRGLRHRVDLSHRQRGRDSADRSTTPWRPPIYAGRSSMAPTSWCIRPRSSCPATAPRSAAWWSTAASSTGAQNDKFAGLTGRGARLSRA